MAKPKYIYNAETCAYEPFFLTGKQRLNKSIRFVGIAFGCSIIAALWFNFNFKNWDEIRLQQKNQALKAEWEILEDKIHNTDSQLSIIESNDDDSYRILLDMPRLDEAVRKGGTGGSEKFPLLSNERVTLIEKVYGQLSKLKNRLTVERQSIAEINKEVNVKEEMMVTRPAMQPIDNRNLTTLHTIFGLRLHPIHHEWKNHNGLDLVAPYGTPVYASGNGNVSVAKMMGTYGNVIFLNHGFGFETRYAHLSKFNVSEGQRVKRGELIGFVGSTGLSEAPHLHYEIRYKDKFVNPVTFLYTDTKQSEYNKLLQPN
jgi:murein DD-endopeptidase MepM/ murein hydrolase activator NlpD